MPRLKKRKIVKDDSPLYPDLFDISAEVKLDLADDDLPIETPYVFDEEELNKKLVALKERADEREKQLETYYNLINLLILMKK